jgi:hypothetical protein
MDDPTAGLRARLTRPGRSIPSSARKDVNLPDPNKKKSPSVMDSLREAGKGLQQLRELSKSSRSQSKR